MSEPVIKYVEVPPELEAKARDEFPGVEIRVNPRLLPSAWRIYSTVIGTYGPEDETEKP